MVKTMADSSRYAIYYAPESGSALDRFGAHLLGYDAYSGKELPFPDDMARAVPDWRQLTQDPRKYGFHATLKAPISLADGKTETELLAACAGFAETRRPIPIITPVVNAISDFIAIVPAERSAELEALAADCVGDFDPFRAPLTAEDRARRNPSKLSPQQCDYLDRWGYPYVMEEFRFHMTLTGRLPAERRATIVAALRERFATQEMTSLTIDRLVLFRQNSASARFGIIGHWPLRA
jgi:putative phosphonate metabolism protein